MGKEDLKLITFDMGGTSTDVALVQDLKPRIGRETTVGDLKVGDMIEAFEKQSVATEL